MIILYDKNLPSELAEKDIFLDTNSLIAAISISEIEVFLKQLNKDANSSFLTIPSVIFEFTRGSHSVGEYNKKAEFVDNLVTTIYPIEKHIEELQQFIIVLQKIKGDISYTDFLLLACLYKFPKTYLMSSNHKDCPIEILDRKYIITIGTEKEIRNYGIYQVSLEKFNKAAESILRS